MPVAITFYSVVLAVHIAAVVIAFGVNFTYPVLYALAQKRPRHLPFAYRLEYTIGTRVIQPSLVVIILAGAYLASKGDYWGEFWVQWSLGAAIVLGALGGALFTPTERRIIDVAGRDVAASTGDTVTFSAEHDALARRLQTGGIASSLLVLVTIFVMTAKPFA
jgi:hypothetical protein